MKNMKIQFIGVGVDIKGGGISSAISSAISMSSFNAFYAKKAENKARLRYVLST